MSKDNEVTEWIDVTDDITQTELDEYLSYYHISNVNQSPTGYHLAQDTTTHPQDMSEIPDIPF